MQISSYEVEVLVNGKSLKEYFHKGKVFIEGRRDTVFSLRLRNNTGQRKLFIPSIDGLSVMSGDEAGENSGGYIVRPYSSITIDGWRTSDKEVAEFYFSSPGDSYGDKIGKGKNLGVIGCMVFDEYIPPQVFYTHTNDNVFRSMGGQSGTSMFSASNASVSSLRADLGTGWGEAKRSEVVSVDFDRTGSPVILEIYYNSREQLQRMGVPMREAVYVTPQAFPGRYCAPPVRKGRRN